MEDGDILVYSDAGNVFNYKRNTKVSGIYKDVG